MDVREHQLTTTIDGVEVPISPNTEASTVHMGNENIAKILEKHLPIKLTYQEYLEKIKSGEITDADETYYEITDDVDGMTISDSVVSRSSTFSSKKILELITNSGGGTPSSSAQFYTKTVEPSDWSGNSNPATASITLAGISDDSLIVVTLSNQLSAELYNAQSNAVNNAKIFRIKHTGSILTLYAYGTVPTIPIQLEISVIN